MLRSAVAEQKSAQKYARYPGESLCRFYACGSRMDSHCTDKQGVQRDAVTLALGFQ